MEKISEIKTFLGNYLVDIEEAVLRLSTQDQNTRGQRFIKNQQNLTIHYFVLLCTFNERTGFRHL